MVGYFLYGIPYSASLSAVDSGSTLDIRLTEAGFACDAYFSPNMLQPATVCKNGIVKRAVDASSIELVKVKMEVRSDGIFSVVEYINGLQVNLFLDADKLLSAKRRFMMEMEQWF